MKIKILLLAAMAMVLSFSIGASAQTLTPDTIFLKLGYIPAYTIDPKDAANDNVEQTGFAIQAEYNKALMGFMWLGVALEYQRVTSDDFTGGAKALASSFIVPMLSVKFHALGGLYGGLGLSGKYLIGMDKIDFANGSSQEYTKKFDVWCNIIVGYYMPIAEAIFFDVEARFGYNLSNKQYSEYKVKNPPASPQTFKNDINSQFDFVIFVGVGYRASMSDI
jgi:hypothetical protein